MIATAADEDALPRVSDAEAVAYVRTQIATYETLLAGAITDRERENYTRKLAIEKRVFWLVQAGLRAKT